jgi:4-amino-4-deoxy-L-arabinose transferase-like glycosyltransferase
MPREGVLGQLEEWAIGFWRRLDKRAVIVVAVAAGIRLFWIAAVHAQPVSDFLYYFDSAGQLVAGKGYMLGSHPTAYWPPGYPFFLAVFFWIFGKHLMLAKLLNVAMWTATAWLMYVLGKRMGGPTAGLVSGLVVAIYPEYVFFSGLTASENLFVLLLAIVAVLLGIETRTRRQRYGLAAIVGLLLGYAIITRPAAVLLPLTLCFVMWFVKRRDKGFSTALVIGLCALLAMAPWVVRNKIVMGGYVISTNGGPSVWGGAHAGSTGTFMRPEEAPPWMTKATTIEREMNANAQGGKEASAYMRAHPLDWLGLAPTKLAGLFAAPSGLQWNYVHYENGGVRPVSRPLGPFERQVIRVAGLYRHIPGSMTWLEAIEWILGAAGLLAAIALKRRTAIWPFAMVAYCILFMITLSTGQPRYLVGMGPLLAPGIGFLAVTAAARLKGTRAVPEAEESDPASESVAV